MDNKDSWEGDWQENWELSCEDEGENDCVENILQLLNSWERTRRMAVVQLVCYIVHALYLIGVIYHLQSTCTLVEEPLSPMDTPQTNSQTSSSSKSAKRKASMIDVMERRVKVIDSGISNLADAIKEANAIAEKGIAIVEKSQPRCYTEDEVFAGLLDIGVPDNLQLDAFLFLLKSQQKIRAFFGVPRDHRLELLTKMMYGSNDK